jgi:ribonuclease HIII
MDDDVFGSLAPNDREKTPKETIYIGSDESLKGDTFGGLTVAAVLVDAEGRRRLEAMGVQDSKKIHNKNIPILAGRIREFVEFYSVYSLFPEEYNQFSLTGLLNRYHHQATADLIGRLREQKGDLQKMKIIHVVDKYPGCDVGDIMEVGAESNYPEVAAASILARAAALDQMQRLSEKAGFTLPLGSTHVEEGLKELKRRRLPPAEFVKMHFKNVQRILQRLS